MAYLVKGARALGDASDVDWSGIVSAIATPENIKAGTQVASSGMQALLNTVTGATGMGPKPPPAPAKASGMSGTNMALIAGGVAAAVAAGYFIYTRKK